MPETATSTESTTTGTETAAETSGGSTEAQATTEAKATEPTPQELADKLAAAQKVTRDLEAKLKRSDDNRDRVKELEAELAKLQGREAEHEKTLAEQKVRDDALAAANQRILAAEVRAQAAGKLQDATDALAYIDLSSFEVGDDGSVNTDAIAKAVADLITQKPYLAAQGGRFQGDADGGPRKEAPGPAQLTRSDMERMSPEQIAEAHEKGQFADLFAGK